MASSLIYIRVLVDFVMTGAWEEDALRLFLN